MQLPPPKVVKRRTAVLEAGKKRPTLNLFGHGKARKIAAESDDDPDEDYLEYALIAAAGLAGAAGLYWAYQNPEVVHKATQYFGVSPVQVRDQGGVDRGDLARPGTAASANSEPRRFTEAGLSAQDAKAWQIAKTSGDPNLPRMLARSFDTEIAIGDAIPFEFDPKNPQQSLTRYLASRSAALMPRSAALVDTALKGAVLDPDKAEVVIGRYLGFDPRGKSQQEIALLMAEATTDPKNPSHKVLAEIDTRRTQGRKHYELQREVSAQYEALDLLRRRLGNQDIPYRDRIEVEAKTPEDAIRARFSVMALEHAYAEKSPYGKALDAVVTSVASDIDPAVLNERVRVLESARTDGRLTPSQAATLDAFGVENTARRTLISEGLQAYGKSADLTALQSYVRAADTAYLVDAAKALQEPNAMRYAGSQALAQRLTALGLDPRNPETIQEWARSAPLGSVLELSDDAGVAARQTLAVRNGLIDARGRTAVAGDVAAGESALESLRQSDAQMRAAFQPMEHAYMAAGDLSDIPLTFLGGPATSLANLNMIISPIATASGQEAIDPDDPNAPGIDMAPMIRAQRDYYKAIGERMKLQQDALERGDFQEVRRISEMPLPQREDLTSIVNRQFNNVAYHRLLTQPSWGVSAAISGPAIRTRSLAGMGAGIMTLATLRNPNARAQLWKDPASVIMPIAGEVGGMSAAHMAMRYPNSGSAWKIFNPKNVWKGIRDPSFLAGKPAEGMFSVISAAKGAEIEAAAKAARGGFVGKFLKKQVLTARELVRGKNWVNVGSKLKNFFTGAGKASQVGKALTLGARGRALGMGLLRGGGKYAQFNTILAGGRAVGDIGAYLLSGVDDDPRAHKAYLGTIMMGGDVANKGGFWRTLGSAAVNVPLFGDYSTASLISAATGGFNLAASHRTGSRLYDWFNSDHLDKNYQNYVAYQGYMQGMKDLAAMKMTQVVENEVMPTVRALPFFKRLSPEQGAQLTELVLTGYADKVGLDILDNRDYLGMSDLEAVQRTARSHAKSFRISPDTFTDPSGAGFFSEARRYFTENLGNGNDDIGDFIMSIGINNILANNVGVDPGELGEADAATLFGEYLANGGIHDFAQAPMFSSAYRIHQKLYGGIQDRIESAIESSPNMRFMNPGRKQDIVAAALTRAGNEMQSYVEEQRANNVPDKYIIEGGAYDSPGMSRWIDSYLTSIGADAVPRRAQELAPGAVAASENQFRAFLESAVGDQRADLLSPDAMSVEIEANSGLTPEQRGVPLEPDPDAIADWREAVRAMGGMQFDATRDPLWELEQKGIKRPSYVSNEDLEANPELKQHIKFRTEHGAYLKQNPAYEAAMDQRWERDWIEDDQGERQRWQPDRDAMIQSVLESGALPVRYTYDLDAARRDNPYRRSYGESEPDLSEFAQYYDVEYDEQGNPRLAAYLQPPKRSFNETPEEAAARARQAVIETRTLAAADPYAFAERHDVPVEQVMLALELPKLKESLAMPGGGYRVFDDQGNEQVVPTWGQARDALMGSAALPQRRPGTYRPTDFRPSSYSTWENIWGRSQSTRDAEFQAYEAEQAKRRQNYELTPEQYAAEMELRAKRFNRYEPYFSPEMQQYRGRLAEWQNQLLEHNRRLGTYAGSTPDAAYVARAERGLVEAPKQPQTPWVQTRNWGMRPIKPAPAPATPSPAPTPVQTGATAPVPVTAPQGVATP